MKRRRKGPAGGGGGILGSSKMAIRGAIQRVTNAPRRVLPSEDDQEHNDFFNYALLIVLYTIQGIPMGLSASIPFLLQEKIRQLTTSATGMNQLADPAGLDTTSTGTDAALVAQASKLSYQANAVFALCSWPFSLKLLWAPLVDACFVPGFGKRKSWLIPVQTMAGAAMVLGADFVQNQLGFSASSSSIQQLHVPIVTAFFFGLYFLMATQDIAVDGWALTMLSRKNRGRGPICNSIGQNLGVFLSFVGFLALNDVETCEKLWRPLLRLASNPTAGLVSLGGFIRSMGYFMLVTTTLVALFKREVKPKSTNGKLKDDDATIYARLRSQDSSDGVNDEDELDAAHLGLSETYRRLWAVCRLPAVQWLFLVLVTYRFPVALSDNVKFLKAVEYGLSKSTTALLSPLLILPLGIVVPLIAAKIWHGHPLQQFLTAYKLRVFLVPLLDLLMLHVVKQGHPTTILGLIGYWASIIASTAMQAICNTLQFNSQMVFFASRVDPAIGGSYMTLLNTAANLGGTWPASAIMWAVSKLGGGTRDPYLILQIILSVLGLLWILVMEKRVHWLASLPDDAWRTHILDGPLTMSRDVESTTTRVEEWSRRKESRNKAK